MSDRLDVSRQGRAVCARLASELGETINLAVLQGHWAVNVDQALGPSTVSSHNWIGHLTPLHCTAGGKVLLAHLPEPRRAELLTASGMERLTERTVTLAGALEAELAEVRSAGYAVAVEEYETGLNAVAAPVRDRSGSVVAALSVCGPAYRLDEDRRADLTVPLLRGRARSRGGWAGTPPETPGTPIRPVSGPVPWRGRPR